MSIFQALSCFAFRSVLGDGSDNVVQSFGDRFGDGSLRLARALRHANERAWRALEVALAGESLWNKLAGTRASRHNESVVLGGRPELRAAVNKENGTKIGALSVLYRGRENTVTFSEELGILRNCQHCVGDGGWIGAFGFQKRH